MNIKFGFCILSAFIFASAANAWGPHREITAAGLDRITESAAQTLTLQARNTIIQCSFLPDIWGSITSTDGERFCADDYLQIVGSEFFVQHWLRLPKNVLKVPYSQEDAFKAHFLRTVQALKTENRANALRRIGLLLHYVEDCGCPQHNNDTPDFSPLIPMRNHKSENFFAKNVKIEIPFYQPKTFGDTPEEAADGFIKRLYELDKKTVVVTRALVEKELCKDTRKGDVIDRKAVEPLNLIAAKQSAEAVADVVETILALATKPADGAVLEGRITAETSVLPNMSAHITLLDKSGKRTKFDTFSDAGKIENGVWYGGFTFRNLPEGEYTVFVYRAGAKPATAKIRLSKSKPYAADFKLEATVPVNNLVFNPDAKFAHITDAMPDYWHKKIFYYPRDCFQSQRTLVELGKTYKASLKLKDTSAKAEVLFVSNSAGPVRSDTNCEIFEIKSGESKIFTVSDKKIRYAVFEIKTEKPLDEVLEYATLTEVEK